MKQPPCTISRALLFCCMLLQLVAASCVRSTSYRDPLRYSWVVTTFAGTPTSAGNLDGKGTAAKFNGPRGIVRDAAGNMYVADVLNHEIRKITPAGDVTTIAGAAGAGSFKDGIGTAARFNLPIALTIDAANNLYVADEGNNRIRKITPAGVVTTIAGTGGNQPNSADINNPEGIVIDPQGQNLYVAERDFDKIRKITLPALILSVFSGTVRGDINSPNVPKISPQFNAPSGLAIDPQGKNLYVADYNNNRIKRISIVDTFVTRPFGSGFAGWANGKDTSARFNKPFGLVIDPTGSFLYVADWENRCVRKVLIAEAETRTFAGNPERPIFADGDAAAVAGFKNPAGIVIDSEGNFYVTDAGNHCIRKISFLKR